LTRITLSVLLLPTAAAGQPPPKYALVETRELPGNHEDNAIFSGATTPAPGRCMAKGPRIVVFRVGGLIALASPLKITEPYITIAGQTAPGDGICLRSDVFAVTTHDVVVRFLRSRLGDLTRGRATRSTSTRPAAT